PALHSCRKPSSHARRGGVRGSYFAGTSTCLLPVWVHSGRGALRPALVLDPEQDGHDLANGRSGGLDAEPALLEGRHHHVARAGAGRQAGAPRLVVLAAALGGTRLAGER